jgi:N-ATPase, AtpR subunit
MTGALFSSTPLFDAAIGLAGFVFGIAYFGAVQRTATLFAAGSGWLAPAALTIARIAAAATLLAYAAKLGAAPLLAAFAGFLLARAVALRAARRPG